MVGKHDANSWSAIRKVDGCAHSFAQTGLACAGEEQHQALDPMYTNPLCNRKRPSQSQRASRASGMQGCDSVMPGCKEPPS